ncbi:polyphosphate polymerase domain-containing protein [Pelagicoccus mobilis]|uniref:Polyphosphate polymerase domain-containing protein n=1 Tax=Pelagicoccus mobilis TaxID=415221 RepID=A0A934RT48_9BACT|nr:polyphosphate polymerase domain-containing protein [Pelagicoccus mobilis]
MPKHMVDEIRAYARLFCEPDCNASGTPPSYTVSTLQLDSPKLSLHLAKERKLVNRFKLRVRTYGTDLKGTYFFEVKRREENYVRKTRSKVRAEQYCDALFEEPFCIPDLDADFEVSNHLEFLRLKNAIGARPVAHIRYERESWIGTVDKDVRVTMDRNIRYRRAEGYRFFGEDDGKWRVMDSEMGLRRPFGGLVLEIKSSLQVPTWILKMIRHFDLSRTGFCKYSTAMRLESLFSGDRYTAASDRCGF